MFDEGVGVGLPFLGLQNTPVVLHLLTRKFISFTSQELWRLRLTLQ